MSKYIYLTAYGLGEKVRILLSYKKVEHVDERLTFEEHAPRKAAGEFPNGQLPVWIQNGKYYNESNAILRFLGKQYGMYPVDVEMAYVTDNAVDVCCDTHVKLKRHQKDKKFGEEEQATYVKNLEQFVRYFDKILVGHGNDFIAGEELTIRDCAIAATIFTFVYNDYLAGGTAFSDKG